MSKWTELIEKVQELRQEHEEFFKGSDGWVIRLYDDKTMLDPYWSMTATRDGVVHEVKGQPSLIEGLVYLALKIEGREFK